MADSQDELGAIRADYKHLAKRNLSILTMLAAIQLGFGLWSVYLTDQNGQRVTDIQTSRRDLTLQTCTAQNTRHDDTIRAYDERIAAAVRSGLVPKQQLARLRESRSFTVGLIDTLAPHQDCAALITQRFGH